MWFSNAVHCWLAKAGFYTDIVWPSKYLDTDASRKVYPDTDILRYFLGKVYLDTVFCIYSKDTWIVLPFLICIITKLKILFRSKNAIQNDLQFACNAV